MRDPELVARARYAAARLEQAWDRWRTLHGLGGAMDPLASYVGYSLKEPMGQPRVVIGLDAAEAEYFADFLESHECGGRAQAEAPSVKDSARQPAAPSAPAPRSAPLKLVARASDSAEHVGLASAERAGLCSAERGGLASAASSAGAVAHAFHQAPVGNGRPQGPPQDAPDVIAAELAGWASGELPGQASEQLAAMAADAAGSEAMDRPRPAASPVGGRGGAHKP
jgi:hypothetical protein